jgi:flagellar motor protein MotB
VSFLLHRTNAIAAALVVLLAGCSQYSASPFGQQANVTLSPQQQTALAQQTQQYQQRAASLDRDNQELQSLLAQSRQQTQLLEEQVRATQAQLRDTTERLTAMQTDNEQLRGRTSAMAASFQTRSQAEIRANNTLLQSLAVSNMPGINVRQDGDVIRIELPGDQLFNFGSNQLKLGADGLLKTIAADLTQNYPQQLIGIEGHTDGSPMTSPQFPTDQHLAVAQSMAVYDFLTRNAGMQSRQLFVVGHGGSHPIVSNATDAGRARNRRVEVVIYPETMRR